MSNGIDSLCPDTLGLVLRHDAIKKDVRFVRRAFRDAWDGSRTHVKMSARCEQPGRLELMSRLKACTHLTIGALPWSPRLHLAEVLSPTQQHRLEELCVVIEYPEPLPDPQPLHKFGIDAQIDLGTMTRLRKLDLAAREFSGLDSALSACPCLEELLLDGYCLAAPAAIRIASLPTSLRVLELVHLRFDRASRGSLVGCIELRELRLHAVVQPPVLPCGTHLQKLAVSRQEVGPDDGLKDARLRELDLGDVAPLRSWFDSFAESRPTLRHLRFTGVKKDADTTRAIQRFVDGCERLESLEVPKLATASCLLRCSATLQNLVVRTFEPTTGVAGQLRQLRFPELRALKAPTTLVSALHAADVAMPVLDAVCIYEYLTPHPGVVPFKDVLSASGPKQLLRKLELMLLPGSTRVTEPLGETLSRMDAARSLEHLKLLGLCTTRRGGEEVCGLPELRRLEIEIDGARRLLVRACPKLASIALVSCHALRELHLEVAQGGGIIEVTCGTEKVARVAPDAGRREWSIEKHHLTIKAI